MTLEPLPPAFDVVAVAAHPDDLEVAMGGTAARLTAAGQRVLFVDLTDGEPARHGRPHERAAQAARAAEVLGVERRTLDCHDRLLVDSIENRLAVARIIRAHRPRLVFATQGSGVHPDHKALTDIVVGGVFYARLPKWDEVEGGSALEGTEPHEVDRLFFARCRMEPPWERFDFAVDVSGVYQTKLAAIGAYTSVFQGEQARLVDRYRAEDQWVGRLVGTAYAEPFRARSPLLVSSPAVFDRVPFG